MAIVAVSSVIQEPIRVYAHASSSCSSPSTSAACLCRRATSTRPKSTGFFRGSLCRKSNYPRFAIFASSAALTDGVKVEELQINVSGRPYPIYIGRGILDYTEIFKRHIKGKDVLLITNPKVSMLYTDQVVASILGIGGDINVEGVVLRDVERTNLKENVFEVVDKAAEARMDRTATFVGLGGGVVNDLCGFSAAVYGGGVNYIQIPTTLTAQVDVAVADEIGIYHLLDKQSICSYYEPECVIVDTNFLKTLPGKELISGIAEVLKFALVRDGAFLRWLKENMEQLLARDPATTAYAIKRSCEIKAEILSLDKQAGGLRDILSLGRIFGNAIQKSMKPGEWLHGEALAVGIVMTLDLAHRLEWIDDSVLIDAIVAIERAHLPTAPPAHVSKEALLKNLGVPSGGHPLLALPKGPGGHCVVTEAYDRKCFDSMLTFFCLGDRA
ncbi:hypothetical protein GOP47_0008323 [Adiantum capillus-veneris]|uniref:3-dehydroquinate synthase domain-containing protein n=1 Tax=Adiantum capillus-veneris TaxID=13818 RepID=A0A9D4UYC5_ADICA|nr:hypothetical protein GOP47_0008323 [Adiantum capillus-veneris]